MTVSSIKVKIVRKATVKLKVLPKFPANVSVANFLTVARAANNYTFSIDYSVLAPGPIIDSTTAYIAISDTTSGVYRTVTLASLLTSGLDADLQAIAALTGTGILARTAANTWVLRTVTGTANEITVTNGDGVAGAPTLSLPASLTFTGKTVTGGTFSSPTLTTPALGTPASGVATNLTGTASGLTAGHVTTNANLTGPVTSVGNATTITANAVTNAMRATMAAYTLKGNATGSTANEADIDITALTAKASPIAADIVLIQDSAASNAFKKTTVGALASAGSVSSYNARTGAVVPVLGDYTYSGNTMALPTRYWSGLTHSNNVGTPNTKMDVAAGVCRDSTDAQNIAVTAGTIDCGTVGANGLDAGSLANTTKYYTFAIVQAGGTQALLASLSPTAPTLPGSYAKFRRIGFFKTDGSAHILPFTHVNNKWYWTTSIRDVNNSAVGTTTIKAALSVPNVQGVTAFFASTAFNTVTVTYNIWPGFLADTAKAGGAMNISATGGGTLPKICEVDSSAQINIRSDTASTTVVIDLLGWQDDL